jgi:hypothetical protein
MNEVRTPCQATIRSFWPLSSEPCSGATLRALFEQALNAQGPATGELPDATLRQSSSTPLLHGDLSRRTEKGGIVLHADPNRWRCNGCSIVYLCRTAEPKAVAGPLLTRTTPHILTTWQRSVNRGRRVNYHEYPANTYD